MLKAGLVGYGYWGTNLFRNLASSIRFEIAAVADCSEKRRAALRSLTHGRITSTAIEVTEDPDIRVVFVATPISSHFEVARSAILSGKHVFVEKPICATVSEAEELVYLADQQGVVLMVDHTYLFTDAVQYISRTIRAGEIGRLCYYDSSRINLGLFQPDVNVLWDLAPHDLSILDHLLDEQPIRITASGYCHINHRLPDMAWLTLHYPSNVVAHLNMSWMSPVKVRRIAFGGTSKMMVWDDLNQEEKIKIYNSGIEFQPEDRRAVIIPGYRTGDIYSPRLTNREALTRVMEHLADVIEGKETSVMDGRRGLRIVRTLERAQKALDVELEAGQAVLRRP